MDRPRCETCVFRNKTLCQRNPPQMLPEDETSYERSRWPEMELYDWCGEHQDFQAYLASLEAEKEGKA